MASLHLLRGWFTKYILLAKYFRKNNLKLQMVKSDNCTPESGRTTTVLNKW